MLDRIPLAAILLFATLGVFAQETPQAPHSRPLRPWQPTSVTPKDYLDVIEGVVRFTARCQNAEGAIIDPFLKREHQYATPYFAFALGTLVSEGRARDLLPNGILAMSHATRCFGQGRDAIPDAHGEFFIPALTEALEIYRPFVDATTWEQWREKLRKPLQEVIRGGVNNWETYPMKGEWMRARLGLVDRAAAGAYIEEAWSQRQRERIAATRWHLYHDRSSDPDTLNVEAVGRGNLLGLIAHGYDGPSAAEIERHAALGSRTSLFLQDPTGQAPTNGRTDNHVWVDVGYLLICETMAERHLARGEHVAAGQYRRAAHLAFLNILRWQRHDGEWTGSFFVTKNHFPPELRIGYQLASQYSNYNGSLMLHLSEAFHIARSRIEEQPTPSEIGGYAFAVDYRFDAVFANAGGLLMQASLRGQLTETHGNWWTPLGVVRLSRAGWDSRLGPSDGALIADGGLTFAPAFRQDGRWVHMADLSARYRAEWTVAHVAQELVRCSLYYRPIVAGGEPVFQHDLAITPEGVYSEARLVSGDVDWGVSFPALVNDGRALVESSNGALYTVAWNDDSDSQNVMILGGGKLEVGHRLLRGSYGDLRPVYLLASKGQVVRSFVYPRGKGDPSAARVMRSFQLTNNGFRSLLGELRGNIYQQRRRH